MIDQASSDLHAISSTASTILKVAWINISSEGSALLAKLEAQVSGGAAKSGDWDCGYAVCHRSGDLVLAGFVQRLCSPSLGIAERYSDSAVCFSIDL
jgi:hypothetical protein